MTHSRAFAPFVVLLFIACFVVLVMLTSSCTNEQAHTFVQHTKHAAKQDQLAKAILDQSKYIPGKQR